MKNNRERYIAIFLASSPIIFILGLGLSLIGGILLDHDCSFIIGMVLVALGTGGLIEAYLRRNGV